MGGAVLKRVGKALACRIAPGYAPRLFQQIWLAKQASRLRRQCERSGSLEETVEQVFSSRSFPPLQKKTEVLSLLKLLKDLRPKHLCEIGGAGGGTLFLWCRIAAPDARILSIDVNYTPSQLKAFRHFGSRRQTITCLKADSHVASTVDRVQSWLGKNLLDFLFIDGDHSLAGVSKDYSMYAPYVRQGGIIGFHDIAPDFKTRFGIPTGSDVGEVPAFWRCLKGEGKRMMDIIEDPEQDGFGIGVVFRETALPLGVSALEVK
jgi:predicted O-methyltransferase YrrM